MMGKETPESGTTDYEKISVDFHLRYASRANLVGDEKGTFNLGAVSGFTANIAGCASGYLVNGIAAASSTTTVKLYAKDRNCTAELVDFIYNGKTYVKSGGGVLSSGVANFEDNSNPGDILIVSVVNNLPSPLTDAATASFAFHEIEKGSDKAIADYSYSETLEVQGTEAPNFEISDIRIDSIDALGEATFGIFTECGQAMTLVGSDHACTAPGGDVQLIKDMKVKLIYNDPALYPGNILTYTQAETIMETDTAPVLNVDYDASSPNGGFMVSVAGAGQLYTHRSMFFIISVSTLTGGESYRYFHITIGDPL